MSLVDDTTAACCRAPLDAIRARVRELVFVSGGRRGGAGRRGRGRERQWDRLIIGDTNGQGRSARVNDAKGARAPQRRGAFLEVAGRAIPAIRRFGY